MIVELAQHAENLRQPLTTDLLTGMIHALICVSLTLPFGLMRFDAELLVAQWRNRDPKTVYANNATLAVPIRPPAR